MNGGASSLQHEIAAQLYRLPIDEQRRVLAFARALAESKPRGEPGRRLMIMSMPSCSDTYPSSPKR